MVKTVLSPIINRKSPAMYDSYEDSTRGPPHGPSRVHLKKKGSSPCFVTTLLCGPKGMENWALVHANALGLGCMAHSNIKSQMHEIFSHVIPDACSFGYGGLALGLYFCLLTLPLPVATDSVSRIRASSCLCQARVHSYRLENDIRM